MERTTREMTFEEEAVFYEKEACAEFAKETGGGDCSVVNSILRRGMRIIRKARQEIASREVVHGRWVLRQDDGYEWYECSSCRAQPLNDNVERPALSDYCPNCGAKMDLRGD